ncbi:Peroxisome proliferator-activated receptor gamma coactivator-related protein 1 [Larimichthys crocea]|uniref:Peroxisome proliferator-activated receptor gamma coactivator-related protein 1 n=1 Tax=Larimichthys crocea TaxID=215358 RepID=A0A6G0HMZ3_LARCR|nr:Peroxisome proliferator-activated receptor gamma coactivator-related protein 1 [Larimichthys crocea]
MGWRKALFWRLLMHHLLDRRLMVLLKKGAPGKDLLGGPTVGTAASRTPSPRPSPKERTGGIVPVTLGAVPALHPVPPLGPRPLCPAPLPGGRRKYSYSSSRSGSWSRSRSRSQSPHSRAEWAGSRRLYRPSYGYSAKPSLEEVKRTKEKAIEERRVVYVGRIRGTMTQKELRERFSLFGEIEDCTLHFRDHGDNYGFVTYYDTKDAFTAIENGSRLRKPDELPFDLCFGGRRQFCQSSYADLDSSREYDSLPAKGKIQALDFDTLLKQAQQNLKR